MTDSTAAPVKGTLNAFRRGITLSQRICRNARNGSATHTLDTIEPAEGLQKSLAASELRVKDAYAESVAAFGKRFSDAIINDAAITNRLQALTINLQDHVMSLDDYMDDPEAFDLGSFRYIQRESERCCDQAIHTLGLLHKAMLQAGLKKSQAGTDDRSLLSSQQSTASTSPRPIVGSLAPASSSISGQDLSISPGTRFPIDPPRPGSRGYTEVPAINTQSGGPSHYDTDLPTPSSYGNFKAPSPVQPSQAAPPPPPPPAPVSAWEIPTAAIEEKLKQTSTTTLIERKKVGSGDAKLQTTSPIASRGRSQSGGAASLRSTSALSDFLIQTPIPEDEESTGATMIKSEEVLRQRMINDEFLEKRRRSRMSFSQEIQQIRQNSRPSSVASPIEGSQLSSSLGLASPSNMVASPSRSRPGSELLMVRSQSREGYDQFAPGHNARFSTATTDSRPSVASVASETASQSHPRVQRQDSGEPMMFGAPESPPLSNRGSNSNNLDWDSLARTLRTPDFGRGVEDGIQVVGPGLISDPGLILAAEVGRGEAPVTPAISIQTVDFPIGQDSSFYQYGGFCEGAKMMLAGSDPLKIQKKPGGIGFTALVSMKCSKCSYEIGFDTYENDKALDPTGIYNIVGGGGLKFRQRFLTKSHVNAKNIMDSAYGCLFCIEEAKTVDAHDATVFFSVTQLLTHIQKHSRPLPQIPGLTILYGDQPGAVDFDLCFKDMMPAPNPFADLMSKFSARPTARAIVNHRPNHKGYRNRDPASQATLQFAVGAKIVGVTYPPMFKGEWCCGYHDNTRAFFPANTIQLDPPSKDSVQMRDKSTIVATAKWAHQPPGNKSDTWLSFKPKETIKNIGFPYEDFWCWSGMNSKGKYGLFPACYVENAVDSGPDKGVLANSVRKVSTTVTQVLNDGAKERWNGAPSGGMGMWGVMTTASVNSNPYAANMPRPVRKGGKRSMSGTNGSDSGSVMDGNAGLSPSTPVKEGRSFLGMLGRRNTNASRESG